MRAHNRLETTILACLAFDHQRFLLCLLVCEGNLLPLLGYVLLLWVWLVCALLTGVPMACFTWLRWHGCNSGDAKALLYPTKYGVPPIPTAPPPPAATKAVRRLPADQRGSAAAAGGGAAEASGSPSPGSERR